MKLKPLNQVLKPPRLRPKKLDFVGQAKRAEVKNNAITKLSVVNSLPPAYKNGNGAVGSPANRDLLVRRKRFSVVGGARKR